MKQPCIERAATPSAQTRLPAEGRAPPLQQWLDLSYNATLTSLAPLVSSNYVGAGDDITAEARDCDTFADAFAKLIAKTVTLHTSCGT